MLRIFGRTTSSNVQKVLWACDEIGLPFERLDMAGKFGFTDEYLRLNPNRIVPTIDDDGYVLWESNAIVRYLTSLHGAGTLWPTDARVRGDADRWMTWQQTTFWAALLPAFVQLVRTPADKRDRAAIEQAARRSGELSATMEAVLGRTPWMAGRDFTMGDIPLGIAVYRWYAFDIPRPEHPALRRWYERLCERPSYRRHVMIAME
ncbi:MAG: glutathione S-transferase family protein [Alphaproteobacteria bacterium]|nr:glutathione S-transferase family protein [Alphaproteobacteria bacterium]